MNALANAIAITALAFKDKTDKGGEPYILHCLQVMNDTNGDSDEKCAAVLHDIVEDTGWTIAKLRNAGFNENILTMVGLLTHDDKEPYMEYVKKLAVNPGCRKIKMADLRHNSCITRLKGLTKRDFDRIEMYSTAYTYLSKV